LFKINAKSRIRRVRTRDEESEVVLRSIWRAFRRELMSMPGRSAGLAVLTAVVTVLIQPGDAAARTRKHYSHSARSSSAVFTDERDCVAKNALDETQCHNAALNSHAEYEEKAPRFEANDACKQFFGAHNCSMRIGDGPGGIGFIPSYRGFSLARGKDVAETMVMPVLAGKSPMVEFSPRPISRLDTEQDAGRSAQAQAAWQSAHAGAIHGTGWALRYRDAPKDAAPDLSDEPGEDQSGPAATYPVSPAMLKSMQEEMRKYVKPSQSVAPSK
jgi:hypothetical protein